MPVYPYKITGRRIYKLYLALGIVLFFMLPGRAVAQEYGEKSFYLVDSLETELLSPDDKMLLDTTLKLYHVAEHDTTRLGLIEHVVDNCWDDAVWPKYNVFIYDRALAGLSRSTHQRVQIKYASYLAGS